MASPWMERLLSQGAGTPPPDPLEEEREEERERSPWMERVFSQAASPEPRERERQVLTREDIFAPPEEAPEEEERPGSREVLGQALLSESERRLERAQEPPDLPNPVEAARSLGAGALRAGQSLVSGAEAAYEISQKIPTPFAPGSTRAFQEAREAVAEPVLEASRGPRAVAESVESVVKPPPLREDFRQALVENPIETIAHHSIYNLPGLVATLGAAAAGGPMAGAGAAWLQEAGNEYQESGDVTAAGLTGTANMVLEYLPAGRALSKLSGGARKEAAGWLRNILGQALAEGSTESVQEMNQRLAQLVTYAGEEGFTWNDLKSAFSPENLQEYGFSGLIGAVLGGGVGAVTSAAAPGEPPAQAPTPEGAPPEEAPAPAEDEVAEVQAPEAPSPPPRGTWTPGPMGDKFRVSRIDSVGGALALEKRSELGTPSTFYVGRDGRMIDADKLNLIKGESMAQLWFPETREQADSAAETLRQMGAMDLTDPRRKKLRERLAAIVRGEEVQAAGLPEVPSHAGQAGESPEAIARVERGERYFRVTPGGETLPIPNTVDAVDMRPNPGEAKVRVSRDGVLDIEEGGKGTMAQRAAISRLGDGTARELAETLRPTEEVEPRTFELDVGEGLPSEAPETQEMALPERQETRPPQRVRRLEGAQPRTRWGQEVVQKIESDPEGRKYGVRTIVDGLVEQVGAELRVGKEQTRRKNPAHYARTPHMIRARATAMPWMTHEVGHAISRKLDQVSAKVKQEVEQDLVALTEREGSMASAKSAEEGWAEWVRLYVTDPTNMEDIPATAAIESALARSAPETLAHLQDAAIAYDAHMGRESFATWRSHSKARPKKQPLATRIREMAWAAAFKGAARRAGIDYLERNVWRAGKRAEGDRKTVNQKIRRFFESVPGTPGNLRAAYQSVLRVPREVDRAIVGPEAKGARKGLRVLFTGDRSPWSDLRFQLESTLPAIALDDAAAAERLRRKIGRIENIPHRHHGEYAYLTEATPQDVIERLGEQWDDFEAWAQARVALDRHQKKGHDYPGRTAGDPTPDELADIVAQGEDNAEWVQAFEDLETYSNALLAVSVEAGLVKPSEAARILATYDHYLPLLPKIEREMEYGGAGAETPDAGYRRAYGSESAYRPLMEALSTRTRQVLRAYYQNRMTRSALSLIDQAQRSDLPEEAKITLARVATPLRRDNRIAARIEEGDIRGATRAIAEDINARLEEEAGRKLSDEESYSPEDIELELVGTALWRSESPRAIRVIAPMVDGQRRFFQVEDPILWEFFRNGSDPHESIRLLERVGVGMRRAWKRIITQNFVFAIRNLARDATTAMFFGDGPESYAIGYYAAGGMLRKLTGRVPDEVASGELLSRSFETTESPSHRARISGFTQMLEEGVVIDGWNKLSLAEKLAEVPGFVMSVPLKPVEVFLYATGQRYAAQFAEEATRIQAAAQALARGGTTEEAQAAYDYVSGNFADHPGSADIASLYRIPGFLNPGVQITYEIGNRLTHPDPKVRRRHWVKAIPVVSATTALSWALNRLITPDEKEEEMAERADEDKLAYAVIGGYFRVPFDYGPLGAVQSWTWNSLDTMAGQGPKSGVRMAGEILRRAKDLPIGGPMSFLPPQLLAIEENRANYVWYWGDEIEPYWMEWIPRPEDRAFWSTPKVYRLMSRWMGKAGVEAGPLKIQHFVRAGMAYQLDETLAFADGLSRGTVQPGEVHRWPFVGRLLQKPPRGWYSQSVRSISELDKEYQQAKKELEEVESSGDYTPDEIRALENQLDSLSVFHGGMSEMRRYSQAIGEARKDGDLEEARRLTDEMTLEAQRIVEQAATEFR